MEALLTHHHPPPQLVFFQAKKRNLVNFDSLGHNKVVLYNCMVVQIKNKNKNKAWTYVAMTAGTIWYTFRYNYLVYRHATGITTATTMG